MRTNVVLDDELVERAKQLTGIKTKRAVIQEVLRVLVWLREQEKVRVLRGKLHWEGNLDELNGFQQVALLSPALAVQSARKCRYLRRLGVSVRKTIHCFIATYCIEEEHNLLHSDRDFAPFEEHLGLHLIHP